MPAARQTVTRPARTSHAVSTSDRVFGGTPAEDCDVAPKSPDRTHAACPARGIARTRWAARRPRSHRMTNVLLAFSDTGGGHRAAATALREELARVRPDAKTAHSAPAGRSAVSATVIRQSSSMRRGCGTLVFVSPTRRRARDLCSNSRGRRCAPHFVALPTVTYPM